MEHFTALATEASSRSTLHTPSITAPYEVPTDWKQNSSFDSTTFPTEEDLVFERYPHMRPEDPDPSGYVRDQSDDLTGVNICALAFVASDVLSIPEEVPKIVLAQHGVYNAIFRIEFPDHGRTIAARIPRQRSRDVSRIESYVATMTFARYVRGVPTLEVFAWNASADNAIGVPFVLQEFMEDVIQPYLMFDDASEETQTMILNEVAEMYSRLFKPLPEPLHGFGDLVFARDSPTSNLSDPKAYEVKPLHTRLRLWAGSTVMSTSSTSLDGLWGDLWWEQRKRYIDANNEETGPDQEDDSEDDDEPFDEVRFSATALKVRELAHEASRLLEEYPNYGQPCFVNYDLAFHNIFLDSRTHRLKALIDWDEVHIMPFILALTFPSEFHPYPSTSTFYSEGDFSKMIPPNLMPEMPEDWKPKHNSEIFEETNEDVNSMDASSEENEVVDEGGGSIDDSDKNEGADEDGNTTDGSEESEGENNDEQFTNMPEESMEEVYRRESLQASQFRAKYVKALERWDGRFKEADMWEVRKKVLKVHVMLLEGAGWWRHVEDVQADIVDSSSS